MITDLTHGNIKKLITLFCLPILLGNFIQQMYHVLDSLFVGRLIGVKALAALGATAPIFFVFLLIAFGFTAGLSIVTAQAFGAGRPQEVRRSVTHALMATVALSFLICALVFAFLIPLLKLMNVPQEIMPQAYLFMFILNAGLPLIVFYNLLSGIIRALGDSKTPLYFLIFSAVLNALLNWFFLHDLKMGVEGSAFGTIVSVFITSALCLVYVYRKFPILHLKKEDWHFDFSLLKKELHLAVPMAVQFSVLSLGLMVIQSVCNAFGTDVIAGYTAALRIEQLSVQPMIAIGVTMATFSAQNWGAGNLLRIKSGVRFAMFVSFGLSLLATFLVRSIGFDLIAVFLKENNPFIIKIGQEYLNISTLFYFFLGSIFVLRNTLQGVGKPKFPLISSILELTVRSFAAIYLAKLMGYQGILYASPAAWSVAALMLMIGYIFVFDRLKQPAKKYISQK